MSIRLDCLRLKRENRPVARTAFVEYKKNKIEGAIQLLLIYHTLFFNQNRSIQMHAQHFPCQAWVIPL